VLEVLSLAKHPIGGRGIATLGPALHTNQHLRLLDVSECQIEPSGFREFCREMRSNTTITDLILSHDPLRDEGLGYLRPVIEKHPSLPYLDLELTEMADKAIICPIAQRDEQSRSRRDLRAEMQSRDKKKRMCDVEFNAIEYRLIVEIQKAIERNHRQWKDAPDLPRTVAQGTRQRVN
jgi:hypothetical protein